MAVLKVIRKGPVYNSIISCNIELYLEFDANNLSNAPTDAHGG